MPCGQQQAPCAQQQAPMPAAMPCGQQQAPCAQQAPCGGAMPASPGGGAAAPGMGMPPPPMGAPPMAGGKGGLKIEGKGGPGGPMPLGQNMNLYPTQNPYGM